MTHVLQLVRERGEFYQEVDGDWVYAPKFDAVQHPDGAWTGGGGFWTAYQLRVIADELDRLNDMGG